MTATEHSTQVDIVDTAMAYEGFASVRNHATPVDAVRSAYNSAITRAAEAGRTPVMIQVLVRVAPL